MAIITVLAIIAGCAPSAKDKLVGNWHGGVEFDDAAVEQRIQEAGNNPVARALATKAVEAFESGSMSITLKDDGSYTSSAVLGPLSKDDFGTWEIVAEQPTEARVRFTSHGGDVQEATVLFSEQEVVTVPFQGQGAGLGHFRCTKAP
jgi:hypothetical protein